MATRKKATGARGATGSAAKAAKKAPAKAAKKAVTSTSRAVTKKARSAEAAGTSRLGPTVVTPAHRSAMQTGREQARTVREYLEALEAHKPKRGRKRDPERLRQRLTTISRELSGADPLTRVHLLQEQEDLTVELSNLENAFDLSALEDRFVDVVLPYSERRGISVASWRAAGVKPDVLRRAGMR